MGTHVQPGLATASQFVTPQPPIPAAAASAKSKPVRKRLVRRVARDYSQAFRRTFQLLFVALNVWLGALFYLWVRQFETGVAHPLVARPPGVEGWLPIAGLMSLKYWLVTGHLPAIHPATLFLLVSFLAIAFFFRKAFCSWLCPVGTLSEYLWRVGRHVFKRNFHLWHWLDVGLRGLKYLLFGFFAWAVSSMSAASIASFMRSDYGLVADVKMLNFFRYLGVTGASVILVLIVASVFIQNFWCRYLCPYGALFGLVSLLSPLRIRRNTASCIDCAKCAKSCPSALPVDKLVTIKSAECTGCLECIAVCPAEDALAIAIFGPASRHRRVPAWGIAAGVALIFFGVVGYAKLSGHWNSEVPDSTYRQLVPHANEARHPMPGDPGIGR
jgi:polyferredoxin